jgi:hypothetical protein
MKAGLACPYSWDGPGGVQEHIRDPAEPLMDLGARGLRDLAGRDDELPPGHVVPAGRAVPVPCNGAGRSPRGCPAGPAAKWLAEGLQCPPQTSHRIGPSVRGLNNANPPGVAGSAGDSEGLDADASHRSRRSSQA